MKVLHCHRAVSVAGNYILDFPAAGYCSFLLYLDSAGLCFQRMPVMCVISLSQIDAVIQKSVSTEWHSVSAVY